MSSGDSTSKGAAGNDAGVGFPQVDSRLLQRLTSLQEDDPGIELAVEGESVGAPLDSSGSRYTERSELGRGGMGIVYKVYDADLRRNLAMKVLRVGAAGSSENPTGSQHKIVRRFLEEAQVTGQLDHPGIVPLHELGVDSEGRIYFTMRVVRGDDLSKVVERVREGQDGWDLARVVSTLLKVCDAMEFAHAKGVVHRDLKPSNIMTGKFGEVYVMDWGLAKVLGRDDERDLRQDLQASQNFTVVETERADSDAGEGFVTMEGSVCGTPVYMPPEQACGKIEEIDARSDVYSLGAVLYEVLTGFPPYVPDGARIGATTVLRWAIEGPPKSSRELAPGAPPELTAICDKAMARNPDDRYQSMRELQADLRRHLQGKRVLALTLGPVRRSLLWCRRNPIPIGLVAAVLLAAGAGLWIMNTLTTALVRQTVLDGAAMQAGILEDVNSLYTSEVVGRLRGKVDIVPAYHEQEFAIPPPATFLTTLADRITEQESGVSVRHYSDFPFSFRTDGGSRDEFERAALVRLRAEPSAPFYRFEESAGHPVLRFATARLMQQSCVDCHNSHPDSTKRDWKVGDMRGVLSITRPLENQIASTQRGLERTFMIIGAIGAALLILVAWGVVRIRRLESVG